MGRSDGDLRELQLEVLDQAEGKNDEGGLDDKDTDRK